LPAVAIRPVSEVSSPYVYLLVIEEKRRAPETLPGRGEAVLPCARKTKR
jgi:hypothetical protein